MGWGGVGWGGVGWGGLGWRSLSIDLSIHLASKSLQGISAGLRDDPIKCIHSFPFVVGVHSGVPYWWCEAVSMHSQPRYLELRNLENLQFRPFHFTDHLPVIKSYRPRCWPYADHTPTTLPTIYRSHTDALPTIYRSHTDHTLIALRTVYQSHADHTLTTLPTIYRPHTDRPLADQPTVFTPTTLNRKAAITSASALRTFRLCRHHGPSTPF